MALVSILLIIIGLVLFETVSSIDNAIINAEVLTTMGEKSRKWFTSWGLLIAVFVIRGLIPWLIIWAVAPSLGPLGALTATFSSNAKVQEAVDKASSILLLGGGVFLIFLFLHWLFLEEKSYGLKGERFFSRFGVWFFAVISILLSLTVWLALQINPLMAFGAVMGSTIFFITHGFRENAEEQERTLSKRGKGLTDASKVFFLMVIDATFSLDGVLGAFAFTLSVPLILLGNGLGAVFVRQLTVSNMDTIRKYIYLKNGAMYSTLYLGIIMILNSFGFNIPAWVSPVLTTIIIGYFFFISKKELNKN